MSYILEALKKAERDRHAGEAPALDDALRPQASAPRRAAPDNRLRAVAIAVATVVVLGLGGWLLLGSPANRAGDPVAVVEADAADSAPEPALRVDPERLADPVADAPAEAFAEAPAEPLQAFAEEPASAAAVETASTLDELVDEFDRIGNYE